MTGPIQENSRISEEGRLVLAAARRAVAQAIERHRRLGESIVIWRDGKVVTVSPEEIPSLYLTDAPQQTPQAES